MTERIPKVAIIGPAYIDMAVKCQSLPVPGRVSEGSGFSCTPTGSGVNRAIQAAICGCDVSLLCRIGEDCFGQMLKQTLQRYGISTDLLYSAQAISTGIIVTLVDERGENRSCCCPGANKVFSRDEIEYAAAEQVIGSSNVCLIEDELSPSAVVSAIRTAQLHKTRIVLDVMLPSMDRSVIQGIDWPTDFYNADLLVVNFPAFHCASELSAGGEGDLKFIGTELVAKGAPSVVICMGWHGAMLIDRKGIHHVPGIQMDVVDQTGCKDAFVGALTASFGAGDGPEKCVRFAVAAEALARSRFGLHDALPVKEEIITLLQEQPD